MIMSPLSFFFFFFNDTATTEIYTLSLHDALPICIDLRREGRRVGDLERHEALPLRLERRDVGDDAAAGVGALADADRQHVRSEEHTSELQSLAYLVCRLLLEKKKQL